MVREELSRCARSLTDKELPGVEDPEQRGSVFGNESPYSQSGRLLYCLGHNSKAQIFAAAMYFYGYAGHGGAYCLAHGLNNRDAGLTGGDIVAKQWRLVVPDGDPDHFKHAQVTMKTWSKQVMLIPGNVPNNVSWVRENVCPSSNTGPPHLDLWATDFDIGAPPHLWQNVLTVCQPRFIFVENSGMYKWCKHDRWHIFQTKLFHDTRRNRSRYALVVAEAPSRLAFVKDRRKHSLYMLIE